MIEQRDKEMIANKLKRADLQNASRTNCGKLKSVVQTLFRDDPEKQEYMIWLICEKDPYLAAKAIMGMPSRDRLQQIIEKFLDEQHDVDVAQKYTRIAVFFCFQEKEKLQEYLRKYADQLLKANWNAFLEEIIGNIAEWVRFLDWASEVDELPEQIIRYIIDKFDYSQYDVRVYQEYFQQLLMRFTEQQRYVCCFSLITQVGVDTYYKILGMSYDKFAQIFDRWGELLADSDKKKELGWRGYEYPLIELSYCKSAYCAGEINAFTTYRTRYREQFSNARGYFLSFLYEYQMVEELSANTVKELEEAADYTIRNNELKFFVIELARCVESCLKRKKDISQLLQWFQPINICDQQIKIKIPIIEILEDPASKTLSPQEFLEEYIREERDLEKIFFLYFNTYFKLTVDIIEFLHDLSDQGIAEEDINEQLSNVYLPGSVKRIQSDDSDVQVGLDTVKMRCLLTCQLEELKNAGVNAMKLSVKVALILAWKNKNLKISQLYPEGRGMSAQYDSEEIWDRCLKVIQNSLQKVEIEEQDKQDINAYSDVPFLVVKDRFDEFMELLLAASTDERKIKLILAYLYWNKVYLYNDSGQYFYDETDFFSSYGDYCISIIQNMLRGGIALKEIIAVYMNTFLKAAISLYIFLGLLTEYFEEEEFVPAFSQYGFVGKRDINSSCIILENMQDDIHHITDAETLSSQIFNLSRVNLKDRELFFTVNSKITEIADSQITDNELNELLGKYRTLSKYVKSPAVDLYKKIRRVPIELYEGREETANKIEGYLREAIYIRRYEPQNIIGMIKALSLYNLYCAKKKPVRHNPALSSFGYDAQIKQSAEDVAGTIIRHAKALSDCFFIYINSFLKQYISIGNYYNKCKQLNQNLDMHEFAYSLLTVGTFRKDDCGIPCYVPRDISCECTIPYIISGDAGVENNKAVDVTEGIEYVISLMIRYESGELHVVLENVYFE